MWRPTNHTPEAVRASASVGEEAGIGSVVCHALYLVNLASPDPVIYEKSIAAMRASLEAADAIGAEGVIFHVGSHLGAGFDAGLERDRARAARAARADDRRPLAADGELGRHRRHDRPLDRRARARSTTRSTIIRGSASASTPATGTRRASTSPTRRRSTPPSPTSTAGSGSTGCAACTSTTRRTPLGSNRDRHDSIGQGLMGEGLGTFLAHPAFQELPAILETPGPDGHGPDAAELRLLRTCTPTDFRQALAAPAKKSRSRR